MVGQKKILVLSFRSYLSMPFMNACLFTSQVPSKGKAFSTLHTSRKKIPRVRNTSQRTEVEDEPVESMSTVPVVDGVAFEALNDGARWKCPERRTVLWRPLRNIYMRMCLQTGEEDAVITKSKLGVVWFQEEGEQLRTTRG